ncbi:response regulator [Flaviaesturariibacter amylovorans]|uniref:Response regulator n=1 Tax=Flaviaesturariibacter amylovorans TaxID=1084520 RepID=A0ABP8HPB0_9BACT
MNTEDTLILMVDDDEEDRFLLQDTFDELGYGKCIHFEDNGEKALGYLAGARASGALPTLVILDLNMPKLNGRETLRQIKASPELQHLTVVIFSTSLNPIERDECLTLGAHSYEVKPNSFKESLHVARRFYELAGSLRSGV